LIDDIDKMVSNGESKKSIHDLSITSALLSMIQHVQGLGIFVVVTCTSSELLDDEFFSPSILGSPITLKRPSEAKRQVILRQLMDDMVRDNERILISFQNHSALKLDSGSETINPTNQYLNKLSVDLASATQVS